MDFAVLGVTLTPYSSEQSSNEKWGFLLIGISIAPRFLKSFLPSEEIPWARGTFSDPDKVFSHGFKARGTNFDLVSHTFGIESNSAYVATSRSLDVALKFPRSIPPGMDTKFIYLINPHRNAVDVVKALLPEMGKINGPSPEYVATLFCREQMAVPYEVKPQEIIGAWKVKIDWVKAPAPPQFKGLEGEIIFPTAIYHFEAVYS